MAIEFKLPELGENIESGDLVRVIVKQGDTIEKGQPVVELETDKAVIEVPSTVGGKVQEVKVKEGQKLKVGDVILTVEGTAAAPVAAKESPKVEAKKPESAKAEKTAQAPAPTSSTVQSAGKSTIAEFRLPELGENIEAGDVVRVLVEPGKPVVENQSVLELETDKAVVEVPSTVSGVVREVMARQGQKIKVGEVIFTLEAGAVAAGTTKAAASATPAAEEEASSSQLARQAYQSARQVEGKSEHEAFPPDAAPVSQQEVIPPQLVKNAGEENRAPVPASPSVRRLAREIGVDIFEVKGTGPSGRISEADVKSYAKAIVTGAAAAVAAQVTGVTRTAPKLPDFSKWGAIAAVSMRSVRRKTAEHLVEAWNTIPHVTQHDKADVTELEELRKRFAPKAELAGGKMTMTAITLKVVASALKKFPQFNASIDMSKEEIIYKRYVNIGGAFDTDRGLLVPVIRDVDHNNIVELAAELATISKKARDKKITPEDMEGGTFTITNLGGIGGTYFTPIVNHPEVAILGMSRSSIEPKWVNNQFEPRLMLPLSLSYDHRLVDGADAARFLRWVVEALEQPFLLSVQG